MRQFAELMLALVPITSRKARNRFLRGCDQWAGRLWKKGLISIQERQALRSRIADACIACLDVNHSINSSPLYAGLGRFNHVHSPSLHGLPDPEGAAMINIFRITDEECFEIMRAADEAQT